MRLKKRTRAKTSGSKPTRSRKSTRSNIFDGFRGTLGTGAIVVVVISVVAAAMLLAARESTGPADAAVADADAQQMSAPATSGVGTVPAKPMPASMTADATDAESTVTSGTQKSSPVTIAGCLERADQTFRLTDTTGADAPKSRSWKSGFLRKSAAWIEVTDPTRGMRLTNHVGQRVSVTGMLSDRQMQVWSLRRVASSCS